MIILSPTICIIHYYHPTANISFAPNQSHPLPMNVIPMSFFETVEIICNPLQDNDFIVSFRDFHIKICQMCEYLTIISNYQVSDMNCNEWRYCSKTFENPISANHTKATQVTHRYMDSNNVVVATTA